MRSRQQVSRAGLELIKRFEGYRQKAAVLPDGRWTIGYGHVKTARQGAEVSPADAEALLIYDLMEVTQTLAELVYTPLTQNQFDALAAFVFNVGRERFQQSAVLKRINEGALLQAACAFDLWRKAEFEGEAIVIDALVRRRAAEKALFLTPAGGFVPAPTPLLAPQIDYDMTGTIPRQTPVEVVPSMVGDTVTAERMDNAAAFETTPTLTYEVAPPPPPEPDPAVEPAAQPVDEPHDDEAPVSNVLTLTPPDERPEPASTATSNIETPAAANEFDPEPELFFPDSGGDRALADRSVFDLSDRQDLDESAFEGLDEAATKGSSSFMLQLGMALFGLTLFAGGLVIAFSNSAGDTSLLSLRNLGIAFGIMGIICTAFAVYLLLDRLGGRGDAEAE